jgi:predicted Rossmann-fold nucleotide-binding protein
VTLVQTERIPLFPLIMMGSEFWQGLVRWLDRTLQSRKYVSPGDMSLFTVTDDPDEAVQLILEHRRRLQAPHIPPKVS